MIIFLYGLDTYRSRQKLNGIIEGYKKIHKSGLNLRYLDGSNLDFRDFQNETQQVSMFDEKKLIVLTDIFSNQDFKGKFLKNSKKFLISKDIILFYEEETPKVDSFFKFLIKEAKSQEFKPLGEKKLRNWLIKELTNHRAKITPEALELLIGYAGNDIWQLSNEIKKLVSYRALLQRGEGGKENEVLFDHKNGKIELKDIELLVRPAIETDIFKTIDAIAQKNKKRAISLLHQHLEKGDSPLYLLSMINFQFRNLLLVKSNQFGKEKLALHPYVIFKTSEQARKFSLDELKKIYQKIFQVDLSIKTGKIEPETALDLFITQF